MLGKLRNFSKSKLAIILVAIIAYIKYWISLRKYEGGVIIDGIKYQCSAQGCTKEAAAEEEARAEAEAAEMA